MFFKLGHSRLQDSIIYFCIFNCNWMTTCAVHSHVNKFDSVHDLIVELVFTNQ